MTHSRKQHTPPSPNASAVEPTARDFDTLSKRGEPASARRVPRPDVDEGTDPELMEYGGGPSFDDVYSTPLLDWTFEWRNVGRHDGHMASLVVTRNETGLPWTDGWTAGDEALEALMSEAMTDLERERDQRASLARARAPAAMNPDGE